MAEIRLVFVGPLRQLTRASNAVGGLCQLSLKIWHSNRLIAMLKVIHFTQLNKA